MTTKTTKTTKTPKATKSLPSMEQLQARADAIAKAKAPKPAPAHSHKAVIDRVLAKQQAVGQGAVITARHTIEDRVKALKLAGARVDYTGTNNGTDERVWWVLIPGAKEHTDNVCFGKSASFVALSTDAKL